MWSYFCWNTVLLDINTVCTTSRSCLVLRQQRSTVLYVFSMEFVKHNIQDTSLHLALGRLSPFVCTLESNHIPSNADVDADVLILMFPSRFDQQLNRDAHVSVRASLTNHRPLPPAPRVRPFSFIVIFFFLFCKTFVFSRRWLTKSDMVQIWPLWLIEGRERFVCVCFFLILSCSQLLELLWPSRNNRKKNEQIISMRLS